jgi:hypothetical protein
MAESQTGRGLQRRAVMRQRIAPVGRAPLHVNLKYISNNQKGVYKKTCTNHFPHTPTRKKLLTIYGKCDIIGVIKGEKHEFILGLSFNVRL